MDRYQKVEKPRPEPAIGENEIRITSQGVIRNYFSYASTLLQEKSAKEIVLKAMGQAINKTVAIVEIIKKKIPGLHQDTTISSASIVDVWEPIEEGLVPLEMTRQVSMIAITLSTRELNKSSPGYQAPLNVVQPMQQRRFQQPQQYQQQQPQQYRQQQHQSRQGQGQVVEDSYGRGRGRGRGRGARGWDRGGYGHRYGGYGGYGGYGNYGGYGGYGGYGNYGGYDGYGNPRDNGGWEWNWDQGGGRGRAGYGYRVMGGYERGRGGGGPGGRGYPRGRGWIGGGRGGGYRS